MAESGANAAPSNFALLSLLSLFSHPLSVVQLAALAQKRSRLKFFAKESNSLRIRGRTRGKVYALLLFYVRIAFLPDELILFFMKRIRNLGNYSLCTLRDLCFATAICIKKICSCAESCTVLRAEKFMATFTS